MANLIRNRKDSVPKNFIDNGDGTWSEKVSFGTSQNTALSVVGATGGAVNNTPIPAQAVSGGWISVQLTGTWVGVVTFEGSNDGTTWVPVPLEWVNATTPLPAWITTTANTNNIYHGAVSFAQFRVRVSSYTSGTIVATGFVSSTDGAYSVTAVDTELPTGAAFSGSLPLTNAPQVAAQLGVLSGGSIAPVTTLNTGVDAQSAPSISVPVSSHLRAYTASNFTDGLRTPSKFKPQSAVGIAAETTVWTPGAGKKFRLMGMTIACSVAGDVTFRDNTAGTIIAVLTCQAGASISLSPAFGNGILSAAANNVLTAQGPAASTLSGTIFGTEE